MFNVKIMGVNMSKKIMKKTGASTVEYLILIATTIGVLIVFLRPSGPFQSAYERVISSTSTVEWRTWRIGFV